MPSVDSAQVFRAYALRMRGLCASLLRLGSFVAFVGLLVVASLLRSARADVSEALWAVGSRILEFPGAPYEGVRQLQLNGARVSFRTQVVETPLVDVLGHYEDVCGASVAMQTGRNHNAGYIACLDMADAPKDLGGLADRFLRFSETGELRELGAPRYVLARRVAGGPEDRTFLLTMWAERFNLYRVLPHDGADASGRDLIGVPRPPSSQRLLSAWEERQPSGVLVYRVADKSTEELESFYRTQLPRSGWTILERNPLESMQVGGTRMLSAEKANRLVTVLFSSGDDSGTLLTVLASEPS